MGPTCVASQILIPLGRIFRIPAFAYTTSQIKSKHNQYFSHADLTTRLRANALDSAMGRQDGTGRPKAAGSKPKRKSTSQQSTSNSRSINPIKSRIRDLTRLLEHSNQLPAGVRIEKERALAGYKQDLEHALLEKHRHQMISKYHMVRFFERQKASRNLKKLKTRLASVPNGSSDQVNLQEAVHQAEVDLNYTIYHPLTEKYLSLFPRNGRHGSASPISDSPAAGISRQEAMTQKHSIRAVVEQCMQEGSLDALRDGKLSSKYSADTGINKTHQKPGKREEAENKTQARVTPNTQFRVGDDSDGDFFEP